MQIVAVKSKTKAATLEELQAITPEGYEKFWQHINLARDVNLAVISALCRLDKQQARSYSLALYSGLNKIYTMIKLSGMDLIGGDREVTNEQLIALGNVKQNLADQFQQGRAPVQDLEAHHTRQFAKFVRPVADILNVRIQEAAKGKIHRHINGTIKPFLHTEHQRPRRVFDATAGADRLIDLREDFAQEGRSFAVNVGEWDVNYQVDPVLGGLMHLGGQTLLMDINPQLFWQRSEQDFWRYVEGYGDPGKLAITDKYSPWSYSPYGMPQNLSYPQAQQWYASQSNHASAMHSFVGPHEAGIEILTSASTVTKWGILYDNDLRSLKQLIQHADNYLKAAMGEIYEAKNKSSKIRKTAKADLNVVVKEVFGIK